MIQWDKHDLESLGLLGVDVLALGLLSCIRRTLDLITTWHGRRWRMQDVPQDDAASFEMARRADTVGAFQIVPARYPRRAGLRRGARAQR